MIPMHPMSLLEIAHQKHTELLADAHRRRTVRDALRHMATMPSAVVTTLTRRSTRIASSSPATTRHAA